MATLRVDGGVDRMNHISTGKTGEQLALDYLLEKGYRLVEQNWRCKLGEIDLVMQDKDTLVFVEVKSRTSDQFGSPEEAITPHKLKRMEKLAQYYLLQKHSSQDWQIDLAAIMLDKNNKTGKINHLKNIG